MNQYRNESFQLNLQQDFSRQSDIIKPKLKCHDA